MEFEPPELPWPINWVHYLLSLYSSALLLLAASKRFRRRHKVRATVGIPYESLQTVSATAPIPLPLNGESMPDGVRARYEQRRIAAHFVAATATINGSHLLPGRYQSA